MTPAENRLRIARDIVDRVTIGKGRPADPVASCGGKRLRNTSGTDHRTEAPRGLRVG